MSTHKCTWKRRERECAALFGALRQRCSGSSGRNDESASDSTHLRLFIETKLRATWSIFGLFLATRKLARKEAKIPVLCLAEKGKAGCLVVVHSDDLEAFAREVMENCS